MRRNEPAAFVIVLLPVVSAADEGAKPQGMIVSFLNKEWMFVRGRLTPRFGLDTVNLHRMLVPFDRTATWNSLISGVSADGLEALRHKDSFTFGKIAANSSEIAFDVIDTVLAGDNGEANHGWLFLNTGGNEWDFYSSDFDKLGQRPQLVVEFALLRYEGTKEANVIPSVAGDNGAAANECASAGADDLPSTDATD